MVIIKAIFQLFGALLVYAVILALIVGAVALMIYDFSLFFVLLACFVLFKMIWTGVKNDRPWRW